MNQHSQQLTNAQEVNQSKSPFEPQGGVFVRVHLLDQAKDPLPLVIDCACVGQAHSLEAELLHHSLRLGVGRVAEAVDEALGLGQRTAEPHHHAEQSLTRVLPLYGDPVDVDGPAELPDLLLDLRTERLNHREHHALHRCVEDVVLEGGLHLLRDSGGRGVLGQGHSDDLTLVAEIANYDAEAVGSLFAESNSPEPTSAFLVERHEFRVQQGNGFKDRAVLGEDLGRHFQYFFGVLWPHHIEGVVLVDVNRLSLIAVHWV